jgi:hypothetical protein
MRDRVRRFLDDDGRPEIESGRRIGTIAVAATI